MTIDELMGAGLAGLEQIYCEEHPLIIPRGLFVGHTLARLDNPGARHPMNRWSQKLGFELISYGVDFDACCWYFVSPRVTVGRFLPRIGPSRWRDTETVALDYRVSRLPCPIRGILYDEVKPLTDDLCLGLGGINAERGKGDHFFFALERRPATA